MLGERRCPTMVVHLDTQQEALFIAAYIQFVVNIENIINPALVVHTSIHVKHELAYPDVSGVTTQRGYSCQSRSYGAVGTFHWMCCSNRMARIPQSPG